MKGFAGLVAVAAAALPAQQRAAGAAAETTLHAAWLAEVLDLDVPRAVSLYQQVAGDARPGHLERWVAWARLAELRRLGVPGIAVPPFADIPAPLRATFHAAEAPIDLPQLHTAPGGEPAAALQNLAAEAGKLRLRPIVPEADDWLRRQVGPSLRDQLRQYWQRRLTADNRTRTGETALAELNASEILGAELQGRTGQADALRALYFTDWRAPETPGEASAWVARARTRLKTWLAEDLPQRQRGMLEELVQALDRLAPERPTADKPGDDRPPGDATAALALLRRLPVVAERLLAPADAK